MTTCTWTMFSPTSSATTTYTRRAPEPTEWWSDVLVDPAGYAAGLGALQPEGVAGAIRRNQAVARLGDIMEVKREMPFEGR